MSAGMPKLGQCCSEVNLQTTISIFEANQKQFILFVQRELGRNAKKTLPPYEHRLLLIIFTLS